MAQRRQSLFLLDAVSILLILCGLYWFAASFFLAKRSLSHVSDCDEGQQLLQSQLGLTEVEIDTLKQQGIIAQNDILTRNGCWMGRRVDSLIILLVDALRFDFAYYNLPLSIGKRLSTQKNSSRLFQFVADPPTVTMQRLKALTTGGLPTFADISANFGGATVEDDSWVKLLRDSDYRSRGLQFPPKTGFVGDDTWEDLFPGFFTESYPYPSFNTRDLDTVDNGCLKHIPDLLQQIRTTGESDMEMEVEVVHFLGVDHVGHTYGPHNEHMDAKLKEMDAALQTILELLDESSQCHTALIFGDHGMTADGNHGGGTKEEINAALFVHASPACGDMSNAAFLERQSESEWVSETFASIHQIDLVPTISILLGLPIPYANLGGVVPSLLPGQGIREKTASLALNAAQVWRYFTVYSETANRLPNLPELQEQLQLAVSLYKEILAADSENADDETYIQVAGLFKSFLTKALELGQQVWTRFDDIGMISGIAILAIGLLLYCIPLLSTIVEQYHQVPMSQYWEIIITSIFMVFLCGMLTSSNSYILEEEDSIMFCLALLSIMISLRFQSEPAPSALWMGTMLLPVASRVNELFVSGHGLDPSIQLHTAHHAVVFLTSLSVLIAFRWRLYKKRVTASFLHCFADCFTMLCIAGSWWEKRALEPERNGYFLCRIAFVVLSLGMLEALLEALLYKSDINETVKEISVHNAIGDAITILAKVALFIMTVTGPAAAASLVFYTFQASIVYRLALTNGRFQASTFVVAAVWKLVSRHIFFATNHGCFFNRLQYSAAFVATEEFYFVTGGMSLFFNTFGWEAVGIAFAWALSLVPGRSNLKRVYAAFQIVEALTSCISVSVLRRHLMVWDIFAPHFLFTAIYAILNLLSQLTALFLSETSTS